jgi:hypothetical protein
MEISEIVRRFVMRSFELSGRIIIISPARYLLFKRATYLPYTYGETPWQALYDLARFAELDIVTTWPRDEKELQLVYNLAEYAQPPTSILRLYLTNDPPLLLINENEAFVGRQLIRPPTEELWKTAEDIIARSKKAGIFEYDDIRAGYCRHFRYLDVRC